MTRILFLIALLLCAFSTFAADKPNFTGDWKLNIEKSDLGMMPKPSKLTMSIDHKDPELNIKVSVTSDQGDFNNEQKYTLDGKEITKDSPQGKAKITPGWEGDKVAITQVISMQQGEVKVKETWTLSADKKTYTSNRTIESPMGSMNMTMVFDKVEPAK